MYIWFLFRGRRKWRSRHSFFLHEQVVLLVVVVVVVVVFIPAFLPVFVSPSLSLSLSLSLSFSLFLSLFLSLCVRIERCACTTYNLSLLAKRSIFMERIFFLSEEQTTPSTLIFSRSSHRSFFGEWRGLEGIFLFRTKAKSGDDFSLFYLLEASVYLYETNERTHEFSRPKICSPISLERFQSILIRRFCELRVHLEHWLKDAFFQSPIEWYCLSASAKSSGVCFRALVSNHHYVCDV